MGEKDLRTVSNLTAHFNEYKDKGCENRKNLKNFKNVEFQPIKLKENTGDEWVGKTLPPAPLHTNLLGPGNDVLEKMEEVYDEQMELFYKVHCLKKTGEGAGGKFNGPSIKTVFKNLKDLEDMLPMEGFDFVEYLQCLKEVHNMCIAETFDENYQVLIDKFKCKFDTLYDKYKLNMPLKVHVIVDHYSDYFKQNRKKLQTHQ